jgi:cytochrome P450
VFPSPMTLADRAFTLAEFAFGRLVRGDGDLPDGPQLPTIVQTVAWLVRPNPFLALCRKRYGSRFTVRILTQPPTVFMSDPADVKEVLTAAPEVAHPGEGNGLLAVALGHNSVITLDEAPHLEHRRLMAPAFHGAKVERLAGLMEDVTDRYLADMPRGEAFAIHPRLQGLTMEIVLRATFGLPEGSRLDRLREVVEKAIAWAESPIMPLTKTRHMPVLRLAWAEFEREISVLDKEIYGLIAERRRDRASGADASDGADLLSILLNATHDDGSSMRDNEIRDDLITMIVAGHETTASQLAWTLLLLARHPDVQERLHRELTEGEDGGHDYLLATLQEALRCDTSTPYPAPRRLVRPATIGGVDDPVGINLQPYGHLLHHDPSLYEYPDAFRPERFLDSRPVPYQWIPFGGGRRRCLGSNLAMLEMRIVLTKIITRCQLQRVGSGVEGARRRSGITSGPANGAVLRLIDRQGAPATVRPVATGCPAHV